MPTGYGTGQIYSLLRMLELLYDNVILLYAYSHWCAESDAEQLTLMFLNVMSVRPHPLWTKGMELYGRVGRRATFAVTH